MEKSISQLLSFFSALIVSVVLFLAIPFLAAAQVSPATLYLSPGQGAFSVGETFTVSIYVNTGGYFVNAVQADLIFRPDKLQVVSPSVGKSFIEIWVGQPRYSNIEGTLSFQGAVPSPGINVSQGLISTVTFRVRSPGKAVLKFADTSKVLLNDGKGTNVLSQSSGGVYNLVLPPPAGPIVIAENHPDQSRWYPRSSVIFNWSEEAGVDGYSYVLDRLPLTLPDNISEGLSESVEYADVPDGTHYFHIKALAGNVWGGITHYAVNIDKTPPAAFEIVVELAAYTVNARPIIYFDTTDVHSGLDHYEIKIVSLLGGGPQKASAEGEDQNFFIEAQSPYAPELELGKYELIIRAYDRAGNFQEVSKRLAIGGLFANLVGRLGENWLWVILTLFLLLLVSIMYYHHFRKLHLKVHDLKVSGPLSQEEISAKIRELQELQRKYQKAAALVLIALTAVAQLLFAGEALARHGEENLPAPIITTYPKAAGNDEIFYVGGKHNVSGSEITIFVQNEDTGERYQFASRTDGRGDWFYVHDGFLPAGNYQMWTQAAFGGLESPPSSQHNFRVLTAVLRLGASRISFETIYFIAALILLLAIIAIAIFTLNHRRQLRRKHQILIREIREAEESIRRGFAVIKRDIEDELRLIRQIKLGRELAHEEQAKEKTLLEDLSRVEAEIGKEVWDIKLQS